MAPRRAEYEDMTETRGVPAHADARVAGATDADVVDQQAGHSAVLFATFRLSSTHPMVVDGRDVASVVRELEDVVEIVENEGVQLHGWYDVSGLRNDADLMVVLHGPAVEDLQWGLREIRRSGLIRPLIRTWSAVGLANESVAFDSAAQPWLTVSPASPGLVDFAAFAEFLDFPDFDEDGADESTTSAADDDDAVMLDGDIVVHQFAGYGLGDFPWVLAIEADYLEDLSNVVGELMSDSDGLLLETPRVTGRLLETAEIIEVLQ